MKRAMCLVSALILMLTMVQTPTVAGTLIGQEVPVLAKYALEAGQSVFWDGEYLQHAQPTGPLPIGVFRADEPIPYCDLPGYACFDYQLEVLEPAARLRVDLDVRGPDFGPPTSDDTDRFDLQLLTPDGTYVGGDERTYSAQTSVTDPQVGVWTVRVSPLRVTDSTFVLRARLDETTQPLSGVLLPNLRSIAASDFGLTAAVGYYCGFGEACRKAEIGGQGLMSCMIEEQVEQGAHSCLRFAVGSENAGDGPLDLRLSPLGDGSAAVTQVIHHADGTTESHDAGTYEYHRSHAHYHLSGYAQLSLFEVTKAKGKKLMEAGVGKKTGFCLTDERLADWDSFQESRVTTGGNHDVDCLMPASARMVQSPGWGDVYEYDRSGNYVPLPVRDGDYVLRSTVDADQAFIESDERDNVSYAWIRIEDGEVALLEHGYGTDPWDPHKVVSQR